MGQNSKKKTGKWKYMGILDGMNFGFHVDDFTLVICQAADTMESEVILFQ